MTIKEQASWPLIDVLTEAAASKFYNQLIKDFTRKKSESTITCEPNVTTAMDRALLSN